MTRRRAKGTGSVTLHRASGRWLWRLAGRSGYEATREEAERVLEVLREAFAWLVLALLGVRPFEEVHR